MRKYFFFLFFVIVISIVKAQDVSFTQFYNNRQYLNSAYAGAEPGYRAGSNYRNQWSTLPGGYNTNSVGGDWNIAKKDAGIGGLIMSDRSGTNVLNTTSFYLNMQKNIKLYDEFYHRLDLHMGLQAGFVTKKLNWNNLIFSDQLDPVAGVVYTSAAIPPENMTKNYADFGTGALIRFRGPDVHHDLGFAVSHLSRPNQSFYGADSRLPMKFSVHYVGLLPLRTFFGKPEKDFYISPIALADKQAFFEQINLGTLFYKDFLYGGATYRFKRFDISKDKANSAILIVGAKKVLDENYISKFTYSYDITLSGVRTGTGGAHEIALTFEFDPNKTGKRATAKKHKHHGR